MAHFLNGNRPSPQPAPNRGERISLAVMQFVALVRGEWCVQAPENEFRVEEVVAEERYCLGCFGVRAHDVIRGRERIMRGMREVRVCRVCNFVDRHGA